MGYDYGLRPDLGDMTALELKEKWRKQRTTTHDDGEPQAMEKAFDSGAKHSRERTNAGRNRKAYLDGFDAGRRESIYRNRTSEKG